MVSPESIPEDKAQPTRAEYLAHEIVKQVIRAEDEPALPVAEVVQAIWQLTEAELEAAKQEGRREVYAERDAVQLKLNDAGVEIADLKQRLDLMTAQFESAKDRYMPLFMRYAGVLGILSGDLSVKVDEEEREQIEQAFEDAARHHSFAWKRVLNRLEIEPVMGEPANG